MIKVKQFFQQHILPRWWIGVFFLFFIFIFQIGGEKAEETTQESLDNKNVESVAVDTEEVLTVDVSEFKRVQTEKELEEALNEIPPTKNKPQEEKEDTAKQQNDAKRAEQEKQLQRKRNLKNGVILSEELMLDGLTKGITAYYVVQNQVVSEITPILHETTSTIYYEYPIKEKTIIQATALSEGQLIKNITVQVKDVSDAFATFEMMTGIVSPELKKEERDVLLKKMESGDIHKFQTKNGIVYQWSSSGESGILTIMKQKEN